MVSVVDSEVCDMVSKKRVAGMLLAGVFLLVQAAPAVALDLKSEKLENIPAGGNALVTASVPPGATVSAARVYFNAEDKTPEYYLEMVRAGGGNFWAMLPVPKSETKKVDYRVVLSDGDGKTTQTPQETVPVKGKAKVEPTDVEMRYARNLVIGVTDPDADLLPEGFECIGVVSSINIRGELKPNEVCRTVIIPPAVWVGAGTAAAAVGIIVVSDDEKPKQPVSPSRPGPPN
jgi:hypothetical protein